MKTNYVAKYIKEKFEPRREKNEFPRGYPGLLLCRACGAIYYRKAWRLKVKNHRKLLEKFPVKKTFCPADYMIKHKQFEGEIKIEDVPATTKTPLINLIESFGKRAYAKNTQHRIISIRNIRVSPRLGQRKSAIAIATTENQMALQLAKKIKSAFKKAGKMQISYSPSPSDVVYVKLAFNK